MTHELIVIDGTEIYVKTKAGPIWVWVIGMVLLTAPLGWAVARFYSEPMNRRLRASLG